MALPFDGLDEIMLGEFGTDVGFREKGSSADWETVRAIKLDPAMESASGILMILFVTLADSPLPRAPIKGDNFQVDSLEYRVFLVEGADVIGGYFLSLEKAA